MNILWLTNIPLPEASLLMNEKPLPFGGWLVNASATLADQDTIKLSIAFPKSGLNDVKMFSGDKIKFYAFPPAIQKDILANQQSIYLEKIIDKVRPDVVHIAGTEFPHTLAMVNICEKKNINIVVSIQGIISLIAQHYMACLPQKVQKTMTFRDFIKQDNLKQQQNKFIKRGEFEILALKKVKHIIGRTTFDKACTLQINPNVQYHHCNEILRDEFYKHVWDINRCEKNSIFLSQGSYPIKGLHFMLEAMPLVLKRFPDTKLYIGGSDITQFDTLKQKLKISSYGMYIRKLIKKNNLHNHVIFTGFLDEKQMCERYLKSNVFVCPSVIENSPNSLGEAMLLGVPTVSAYVGGIPSLITHNMEGYLYQSNAIYMLAYYICKIFSEEKKVLEMSKLARERALITHNLQRNNLRLIEIYNEIIA